MERFVIIANGFQPLTIITRRSILDVEAVLDPPLDTIEVSIQIRNSRPYVFYKKDVFRNFAKLTVKYLYLNLFFDKDPGRVGISF